MRRGWPVLLLPLLLPGAVRADAAIPLASGHQTLMIARTGGLPQVWQACAIPGCSPERAVAMVHPGAAGGSLTWVAGGDPALARSLNALPYAPTPTGAPEDGATVVLQADAPVDGVVLRHRYTLAASSRLLGVSWQFLPEVGLRIHNGSDFLPVPLSGFGALYGGARPIRIAGGTEWPLSGPTAIAAGEWVGLRTRFWAWLLRAEQPLEVVPGGLADGSVELLLSTGALRLDAAVYLGPVLLAELDEAAPELRGLLFPGLWRWLRGLCFGLLHLWNMLHGLISNAGLAIIALSLAVKVLMAPLTAVAERWQRQVNRIQAILQPELIAIRRDYRGEEAHRRTLEVYRRHGVSPWFTLRSLAGFLIQIPVFIAAFHVMGEDFALNGAGFLWVEDLARPDAWLPLPVVLPFFGGQLNLLPCLMTGLTLLSARLQREPGLPPALLARQRRHLYLLAGAFFVLFYTFPAAMVLYWTANNFWHLVRMQGRAWLLQATRIGR